MPSKTMSVSEDAYDLLDRMKNKGESFSEVIRRLAKRDRLTDCANIWSDVSEDEMAAYNTLMKDFMSSSIGTKELTQN